MLFFFFAGCQCHRCHRRVCGNNNGIYLYVKLTHQKAVVSLQSCKLYCTINSLYNIQLFCKLAAAKQMNCLFLLSGLQMQKLFSLLTMTRKHMWPWILRIMLLIPEVSYLPTEAPEKVQTRKIKITSCTQASLSSSSLTWMVAPFLWWITQTTVEHNFNSN